MNDTPFIRAHKEGATLTVKVQPRASKNEIADNLGETLKVRLTAPPVDSAANEALIRMMSKACGVSKCSVEIIKGSASRNKILLFRGITPENLGAALMNR